MIVQLLGKPYELPDDWNPSHEGAKAERPYVRPYQRGSAPAIDAKLTAAREGLLALIQRFDTSRVWEYCGGLGLYTAVIQAVLTPERHTIMEKSADCYRFLSERWGFTPGVQVLHRSLADGVNKPLQEPPPVAVLDHGHYTLKSLIQDEHCLIDAIALHSAVLFTDSTPAKFHLNRERYAKQLRVPIETLEQYYRAGSDALTIFYGLRITHAWCYGAASILLVERTASGASSYLNLVNVTGEGLYRR